MLACCGWQVACFFSVALQDLWSVIRYHGRVSCLSQKGKEPNLYGRLPPPPPPPPTPVWLTLCNGNFPSCHKVVLHVLYHMQSHQIRILFIQKVIFTLCLLSYCSWQCHIFTLCLLSYCSWQCHIFTLCLLSYCSWQCHIFTLCLLSYCSWQCHIFTLCLLSYCSWQCHYQHFMSIFTHAQVSLSLLHLCSS